MISQNKETTLPADTQFMKSGDFFAYIENIAVEDLDKEHVEILEGRHNAFKPSQPIESQVSANRIQSRQLNVEMNVQSRPNVESFNHIGHQQMSLIRERDEPQNSKMNSQFKQNNHVRKEEVKEAMDYSMKIDNFVSEEPDFKANNSLAKSIDERVIKSKKKTFEEMLEEALQKEGQPLVLETEPISESFDPKKINFLKKNTSRRRFLGRSKGNSKKTTLNRLNQNKKKERNHTKRKVTKTEPKKMTESMLEFEQIEQINLNKSLERVEDEGEVSIDNISHRDQQDDNAYDEIEYKYLDMEQQGNTLYFYV